MKKYIVSSLAISAVLVILFYIGNDVLFQGLLHAYFPGLVAFFLVQSILVSWLLSRGEQDRESFALYALGSVVIRFVSAVLFLLLFFIGDATDLVALTVQFMGLYLVYFVFELITVLANLRRN